MSELKLSHLVAKVASLSDRQRQRTIGVRSIHAWSGQPEQSVGGETYCIRQCDSALGFRDALRQPSPAAINILVTGLSEEDLGPDTLLRLAASQLLAVDPWQIVKDRFHVRSIDPRISKSNWIAERLIEMTPSGGVPSVPGGFLDAETVWPLLLQDALGMQSDALDLQTILHWSMDPRAAKLWKSMSVEFREGATRWMMAMAGPVAELILEAVEAAEAADALPIGLVLDVLLDPNAVHELTTARVRLEERFLGGKSPKDESLRRWSVAAKNVVYFQMEEVPAEMRQCLSRADAILVSIGAEPAAYLSDLSPTGFNQRLSRFGGLLEEQIDKRAFVFSDALRDRCEAIFRHRKSRAEPLRTERVKMAVRLLRWLGRQKDDPARFRSFEEAVDYQLGEASFVDWARLAIHVVEPSENLSRGLSKLFAVVADLRGQHAETFSDLFVQWTGLADTNSSLPGVERVLAEVVAPVADDQPILLIVMDGMSTAVFRQLMSDIVQSDWYWLVPQGRARVGGGLATIPSVTERSRSSLLSGRLVQGHQDLEVSEFAKHPELLQRCKPGHPPELFHKAAITPGEETDLSGQVRGRIQDPDKRVVAVVVNAIDDHLEKSQQLETFWTREGIKVLPLLLHEAKAAGRYVVLVSDHGHIIDCSSTYRNPEPSPEHGERWRAANDVVGSGERLVEGSRVVNDSHRIIAAWDEKVRYIKGKKNGYHGGINPQEIVFPIAVLSPTGACPEGWSEATLDDPIWWDEQYFQPAAIPNSGPESGVEGQSRKISKPVIESGLLFALNDEQEEAVEPESDSSTASSEDSKKPDAPQWITRLLESSVYDAQSGMVTRGRPSNELVTKTLLVLDEQGGKLTTPALARAISIPPMRLPGLLSTLIRLLNVDSYDVIKFDQASSTVELNKQLLLKQFEIE